jgi:diguanylate cyclase (GGDEF)-like protein/PAS domain S-box-containing protein
MRSVRRLIEDGSGWILVGVFTASILAVSWFTFDQSQRAVDASARHSARLYSRALAAFRSVYTSEVVDRLQQSSVEVTHDYLDRANAIPLPATLTMLLGERIGGDYGQASAHLYSPYPFPWREHTGGLRDDFAREAWDALTADPEGEFARVEQSDGHSFLRLATADRLRSSCVSCHNEHPSTPRTGWKEGDVRGLLEIRYPVEQVLTLRGESNQRRLGLLVIVYGLGLLGISLVLTNTRRTRSRLARLVHARTQELAASENRIRSVVASVVESVILIDIEGRILSLNPAAQKMFGWSEAELIGRNVNTLMPPPYKDEHDGYLAHFLATGERRIIGVGGRRLRGRRKNGSVFDMELSVSEAGEGDERVFTGIVRDIGHQLAYEQELEQLSLRDSLTGLSNRRAFEATLDEEWRRGLRTGASLAVVLLDIDFFKQFNDKYGHLAGDACLERVAAALALGVNRAGDTAARYGGEEFVLVLQATDREGALAIAERIRRAVHELEIPNEDGGPDGLVTLSAGVAAAVPAQAASAKDLVNRADEALYRAKHAGRNRVVAEE